MKPSMPTRHLLRGCKRNTMSRSSDFDLTAVGNTPAMILQSTSRSKARRDVLRRAIHLSIMASPNPSTVDFSSASALSYTIRSSLMPYGAKPSCSLYGSRIAHRREHLATQHLTNDFTRASLILAECQNGGRRFGYTAQADQNSTHGQLKGAGWDLTVTVHMHTVFTGWVNNVSRLSAT